MDILEYLLTLIASISYGLFLVGILFFMIYYIVAHIVNIFRHKPDAYISSEDETLYGGGGGGGC